MLVFLLQKDGRTSTTVLCTLHKPYKTPGLLPTAFILLYCCSVKLPFFEMFLSCLFICSSWFTAKVKIPFFKDTFSNLLTYNKIQQKKFSELLKEYPPRNDPEQVIFNFSEATLNESEKALLSRGLNFSLPPKQLKYVDYLLN